jgi:hypothetical protein
MMYTVIEVYLFIYILDYNTIITLHYSNVFTEYLYTNFLLLSFGILHSIVNICFCTFIHLRCNNFFSVFVSEIDEFNCGVLLQPAFPSFDTLPMVRLHMPHYIYGTIFLVLSASPWHLQTYSIVTFGQLFLPGMKFLFFNELLEEFQLKRTLFSS